jgi:phosphatidylglycerophosphate synthase
MLSDTPANRRPLKTRSRAWAQALAAALARRGLSADAVSITSVVFALLGAGILLADWGPAGLVVTAACIQLRLLANLLDGLIAVEGGRKSPVGVLYNEIPDRLADSLFIVALGYAIGAPALGWYGALAAAATAYIRVLGGSLGFAQDFRGPMAKPHRMAAMTAGCLLGAVELAMNGSVWSLHVAAWVIAVGATLTCITRTLAIARSLRGG